MKAYAGRCPPNGGIIRTTLAKNTIERRVSPTDIAPTISNYLGIKHPSGAIGNPLKEVTNAGARSK